LLEERRSRNKERVSTVFLAPRSSLLTPFPERRFLLRRYNRSIRGLNYLARGSFSTFNSNTTKRGSASLYPIAVPDNKGLGRRDVNRVIVIYAAYARRHPVEAGQQHQGCQGQRHEAIAGLERGKVDLPSGLALGQRLRMSADRRAATLKSA
jgi:hypothetical protein